MFLAWTNELKVATHVEPIAARNFILLEDFFRVMFVVDKDALVCAVRKSAFCGAQDHFASRRALARLLAFDA